MTPGTVRGLVLAVAAALASWPAAAADAGRQEDVARRGAEVMPFDLKATTHAFSKTARGGTQQVVVRDPADHKQVRLVRKHLKQLRDQFMKGDFSAPEHIHGAGMPGLAELQAAPRRTVNVRYAEIPGGGSLIYTTYDPAPVCAVTSGSGPRTASRAGSTPVGANPAATASERARSLSGTPSGTRCRRSSSEPG